MKILLPFFLVISSVSFAQDSKAEVVLEKMSSKIEAMTAFYIEFSVSLKNSNNGTNSSETGKGWVKGQKFHASYGDNTIISNGTKTWTIIKDEKTTYVTDADDAESENMNPKKLMNLWEDGFKNKYEKESTLNEAAVHVINLYPKDASSSDYHTIVLYITKSSSELKKAVMKANDGTVLTYSVTKFTSNPVLEDSKFTYDSKKYPGYELVYD
jgi:outer membrane lipoprotein-sorting protein